MDQLSERIESLQKPVRPVPVMPSKPSTCPGAMATFLVSTHQALQQKWRLTDKTEFDSSNIILKVFGAEN
jgi:hypothetical protein